MKFLKDLLLENWGLKLTSIFLALFLWMVVRGDPSAERVVNVALEIRLPPNMEITSERPTSVDVTVRGAFTNLWFSPTIPTYVVNLQNYDEGEHSIQLSPQNVRFPRASGLEPIAVRPARLRITLERTAFKSVPIRVVTRGEPGPGIDVYGIATRPPTVNISGPHSHIEPVRDVPTEILNLADRRQSFERQLSLDIQDDLIHSTPTGLVEVDVTLGPHRRLQRIGRIPIVPTDPGFIVRPRWLTVELLVPITYERGLTAAQLAATVNTAGLAAAQGPVKVKPEVKLNGLSDPAIVIKNVLPPEVEVERTVQQ